MRARVAKVSDHLSFKILSPKQTLQIFPTVLTEINAGNNSKKSPNEIRQIIYFLYQAK